MAYLVQPIPSAPLDASIVLHVRAHCRGVLNGCDAFDLVSSVSALKLLFGFEAGSSIVDWPALARSTDPVMAAVDAIGAKYGKNAVEFSHDADFVRRCVGWLRERFEKESAYADIFASDPETLLVLSEALDLATGSGTGRPPAVLICGETGTGKELLAKAMHSISSAAGLTDKTRFVPVHVAGLSPDFVNDELFGHKKGGFTGATSERKGRIEEANGGTLLIDEVGDLSREAQLRLLRVLEDGRVTRIGDESGQEVSVRVLAATNRDLDEAVRKGRFRLDLLHRLRRGSLVLPPLRSRPGWQHDVVDRILRRRNQRSAPLLVRSARDALASHGWPGNLRELDGVLEIASASARGGPVRVDHLPRHLQSKFLQAPLVTRGPGLLCDDLDPQALDAAVLAARISRLRSQIADTPFEQGADVAVALGYQRMQESIPDRSPEHVATVKRLQEVATLIAERDRILGRAGTWRSILESGIPDQIGVAVESEVTALDAEVAKIGRAVEERAQALDLGNDPWWKFMMELAGLPVFDEKTKPALQQFVVFASRALVSISPELADKVFSTIRAGGLAAFRAAAGEFLRKNQVTEGDPIGIESLAKQDWLDLHERFPKRAHVANHLGCDVKTVMKHVKVKLGEDPWARSTRKRPSATRARDGRDTSNGRGRDGRRHAPAVKTILGANRRASRA